MPLSSSNFLTSSSVCRPYFWISDWFDKFCLFVRFNSTVDRPLASRKVELGFSWNVIPYLVFSDSYNIFVLF